MPGSGRPVVFTLGELSRMVGWSTYRTANLLRGAGIPIARHGTNRRVIKWAAIERCDPDLADSIRFRIKPGDK